MFKSPEITVKKIKKSSGILYAYFKIYLPMILKRSFLLKIISTSLCSVYCTDFWTGPRGPTRMSTQKDFDYLTICRQPEHSTKEAYITSSFILQSRNTEDGERVDAVFERMTGADCAMIDADALSPADYEPIRVCRTATPPKRFYRSFWTSVARRMLEVGSTAMSP